MVVDQRRLAVGLTRAELAARVGDRGAIRSARLWRDHDRIPLGLLERLCVVLDLHPVELFGRPLPGADRDRLSPPPPPGDAAVVEAALGTLAEVMTEPVSIARLAQALNWPLDRLAAALAAVEDRLCTTGLRLERDPRHGGAQIRGIRPRHALLTPAQRTALHRIPATQQPLTEDAARALYTATFPEAGPLSENTLAFPRDVAIQLQRQGLVEHCRAGFTLDPTDEVRYSLDLDDLERQ